MFSLKFLIYTCFCVILSFSLKLIADVPKNTANSTNTEIDSLIKNTSLDLDIRRLAIFQIRETKRRLDRCTSATCKMSLQSLLAELTSKQSENEINLQNKLRNLVKSRFSAAQIRWLNGVFSEKLMKDFSSFQTSREMIDLKSVDNTVFLNRIDKISPR